MTREVPIGTREAIQFIWEQEADTPEEGEWTHPPVVNDLNRDGIFFQDSCYEIGHELIEVTERVPEAIRLFELHSWRFKQVTCPKCKATLHRQQYDYFLGLPCAFCYTRVTSNGKEVDFGW